MCGKPHLKTLVLGCLALVLPSCRTTPPALPPATRHARQFAAAEAKFLAAEFDEAETAYDDVITRTSLPEEQARARYWRGLCRLKLGRPIQAKRDFEVCLTAAKGSDIEVLAEEGIADSARALGNFDAAEDRYEALADDLPRSTKKASLLFRLGQCQIQAGRTYRGKRNLEQAARMDPSLKTEVQDRLMLPQGRFTAQVGAFSKRSSAQDLAAKLKRKGLPAEVHERQVSGRRLYSVWSGQFRTKREAEQHAQKLKRAGFDAIVVP